jgi:hypothetical protein
MAGTAPGVEVEGAEEFRKAMRKMGRDLGNLKAIHQKAGDTVLHQAQQIVPVVSGDLKKSIKLNVSQKAAVIKAGNNRKMGKAVKGRKRAKNGAVPYAGPIHFGWYRRGISPQPFLYDALDKRRAEVIAAYEDDVDGLVRRLDRETP